MSPSTNISNLVANSLWVLNWSLSYYNLYSKIIKFFNLDSEECLTPLQCGGFDSAQPPHSFRLLSGIEAKPTYSVFVPKTKRSDKASVAELKAITVAPLDLQEFF